MLLYPCRFVFIKTKSVLNTYSFDSSKLRSLRCLVCQVRSFKGPFEESLFASNLEGYTPAKELINDVTPVVEIVVQHGVVEGFRSKAPDGGDGTLFVKTPFQTKPWQIETPSHA